MPTSASNQARKRPLRTVWLISIYSLWAAAPGCSDRAAPTQPHGTPTQAPPVAAPGPPQPSTPAAPNDAAPVPADGFPSGTFTPEGAAADLASAFITHNATLFRTTCMPRTFGRVDAYAKFLDGIEADMDAISRGDKPTAGGPLRIAHLFKARHLTAEGPASFGYAVHDLDDIMFVDVQTPLDTGEMYTNRTLVLQLHDKSWRAMPRPDLYERLSTGLNDEAPSTEEWKP